MVPGVAAAAAACSRARRSAFEGRPRFFLKGSWPGIMGVGGAERFRGADEAVVGRDGV